jgi:hypothetical protein
VALISAGLVGGGEPGIGDVDQVSQRRCSGFGLRAVEAPVSERGQQVELERGEADRPKRRCSELDELMIRTAGARTARSGAGAVPKAARSRAPPAPVPSRSPVPVLIVAVASASLPPVAE